MNTNKNIQNQGPKKIQRAGGDRKTAQSRKPAKPAEEKETEQNERAEVDIDEEEDQSRTARKH